MSWRVSQRAELAVRPVGDEEVGLLDALGRTLAEEVVASEDVPPFANSAMDGFAVRSADTPGRLPVVDRVAAGRPSDVGALSHQAGLAHAIAGLLKAFPFHAARGQTQ